MAGSMLRTGPWTAFARSDIGRVRARLEDAWQTVAEVRFGGQQADAFAVFDGLGGEPHGREAARAAAQGLRQALESSTFPADVLLHLNQRVLATRGATTAVVAVLPRDSPQGWLLSVGDSAAYALDEHADVVRLTPRDSISPNELSDSLGNPALQGHVQELRLHPEATLALVTDGVDGVVEPALLRLILLCHPRRWRAESAALFKRIEAAGAPDNATLLLVRKG